MDPMMQAGLGMAPKLMGPPPPQGLNMLGGGGMPMAPPRRGAKPKAKSPAKKATPAKAKAKPSAKKASASVSRGRKR